MLHMPRQDGVLLAFGLMLGLAPGAIVIWMLVRLLEGS
jgi:hypothetical protein